MLPGLGGAAEVLGLCIMLLGIASHHLRCLVPSRLVCALPPLLLLRCTHAMQVVVVDHSAHGVDLPEDVASIEQLLKQRLGVE